MRLNSVLKAYLLDTLTTLINYLFLPRFFTEVQGGAKTGFPGFGNRFDDQIPVVNNATGFRPLIYVIVYHLVVVLDDLLEVLTAEGIGLTLFLRYLPFSNYMLYFIMSSFTGMCRMLAAWLLRDKRVF